MSDSKVREDAYDAWTRTVGVSNAPGGNLAMSPLDAWRAAWQASRAAALKEAVAACEKVARDAAENGLSKPFNFVDGAYHAAEAVSALAGRGA